MNGYAFADFVAATNFDHALHGIIVRQVLWFNTDSCVGNQFVSVAHISVFNEAKRTDMVVFADGYTRSDYRIGADMCGRIYLSIRRNNGRGVNMCFRHVSCLLE